MVHTLLGMRGYEGVMFSTEAMKICSRDRLALPAPKISQQAVAAAGLSLLSRSGRKTCSRDCLALPAPNISRQAVAAAGLSLLSRYGSKDTAASTSSAQSASSGSPSDPPLSAAPHEHESVQQQQGCMGSGNASSSHPSGDTQSARPEGVRPSVLVSDNAATSPSANASPSASAIVPETVSTYGPALRPDGYEEPAGSQEDGLANAACGAITSSAADVDAQSEGSSGPQLAQAAGPAAALAAGVDAELAAEPAAPGMEPEGPMPSSEMQLIITKLAGFIQVGFHLASATLPVRCHHLSLACAFGA